MFQVLCLDECTANIDIQTASIIQNVITSECQGMTVITIAHRISTVLSMDNILVLEKGTVVCSPLLYSFHHWYTLLCIVVFSPATLNYTLFAYNHLIPIDSVHYFCICNYP